MDSGKQAVKAHLGNGKFAKGQVIWAKLSGYPHWPAVVSVEPHENDGKFRVWWLNDDQHSDVRTNEMWDFAPNYDRERRNEAGFFLKRGDKTIHLDYLKAVEEAVNLICDAYKVSEPKRIDPLDFAETKAFMKMKKAIVTPGFWIVAPHALEIDDELKQNPRPNREGDEKPTTSKSNLKVFNCDICNFTSRSESELSAHLLDNHRSQSEAKEKLKKTTFNSESRKKADPNITTLISKKRATQAIKALEPSLCDLDEKSSKRPRLDSSNWAVSGQSKNQGALPLSKDPSVDLDTEIPSPFKTSSTAMHSLQPTASAMSDTPKRISRKSAASKKLISSHSLKSPADESKDSTNNSQMSTEFNPHQMAAEHIGHRTDSTKSNHVVNPHNSAGTSRRNSRESLRSDNDVKSELESPPLNRSGFSMKVPYGTTKNLPIFDTGYAEGTSPDSGLAPLPTIYVPPPKSTSSINPEYVLVNGIAYYPQHPV